MRVDFQRWPMQRLPAVPMGGAMCPQRMPPLLAVLRALERRWCGRGHRTIAGTVSLSFGRPFVAGQSDMSGLATSVACIAIAFANSDRPSATLPTSAATAAAAAAAASSATANTAPRTTAACESARFFDPAALYCLP